MSTAILEADDRLAPVDADPIAEAYAAGRRHGLEGVYPGAPKEYGLAERLAFVAGHEAGTEERAETEAAGDGPSLDSADTELSPPVPVGYVELCGCGRPAIRRVSDGSGPRPSCGRRGCGEDAAPAETEPEGPSREEETYWSAFTLGVDAVPALPPIDMAPELVGAFWHGYESGFSYASTEAREAYFALLAEESASRWEAYNRLSYERDLAAGLIETGSAFDGHSDSPFDDQRD
jgi:hypothetical protein